MSGLAGGGVRVALGLLVSVVVLLGTPAVSSAVLVAVPAVSPATTVSAGYRHVCGVRADRTAMCWGYDGSGQTDVPADLGTVSQVSAGTSHSCAVTVDGTPVCWGDASEGQRAIPSGIGTVTQISAGDSHTCVIKTDGTPVCWGQDFDGRSTVPAGTGHVVQISAGYSHTCAIKARGVPVCWGSDSQGQTDVPADLGAVSQISAGLQFTCAIKTDGTPVCWGNDIFGTGSTAVPAGIGSVTQISAGRFGTCAVKTDGTPQCWGDVPSLAGFGGVAQVSAGGPYVSCALKTTGRIVCAGNNDEGQLSPPSDPVSQVSAGGTHTCAVTLAGAAECWGADFHGESSPPDGAALSQISAGESHTCAVETDGTPVCWGAVGAGQTHVPAGIGAVSQISAGGYHTCAIKTDGTPVCWGAIGVGQTMIPAGIGEVSQISAGANHTCAIKTDGTPVCWGGIDDAQNVPAGVGAVTQVSAGEAHTCAVETDGTPVCWGDDSYGQASVPADIGAVSQISAGGTLTCAVKTDGTPVCWGDNNSGQTSIPAGIGAVSQISTASSHACAVKTDNTVECWGSNTDGQTASPSAPALAYHDVVSPVTADDVPSGTVGSSVPVSLSAVDDGSDVAATYYATGVSPRDPAASSLVYDPNHKPVLHDGEVIKYFSADGAGNREAVRTSGVAHVGPGASLSPGSANFGEQAVGSTSAPAAFTVTNTGEAPLSVSRIGFDRAGYTVSSETCTDGAVAPGASCAINVRFTPKSAGTKSSHLVVHDNSPTGAEYASLSGVGTGAQLGLSPVSHAYGDQAVGTVGAPTRFTVTNTGNRDLEINGEAFSRAGYRISAQSCAIDPISPGATCTIDIAFAPARAGSAVALLKLTDNTAAGSHSIHLSGTGRSSGLTLSPSSHAFGDQPVASSSAPTTLTITNTGNENLSISRLSFSSGGFTVASNSCAGSAIAPGGTCQIAVVFHPAAPGAFSVLLRLTDNTAAGSHLIRLTGTGRGSGVSVSPSSHAFGDQPVASSSAPTTFTITNSGNENLVITGIRSSSSQFHLAQNCVAAGAIAPNGTCTITATFNPATGGSKTAVVKLTDNTSSTYHTIHLTGSGVAPPS